jgi:porphobilinogen synthase
MNHDLRRLRSSAALRRLVRETEVAPRRLILPIFVSESADGPEPIDALPGQFRLPVSSLPELARRASDADLGGVLVFGLPTRKSEDGKNALCKEGVVPQAVRTLKDSAPELCVLTDVCLCAYTPHGHCGVLKPGPDVRLDHAATASLLGQVAVSHASAGADIVAPSSMVDGQVAQIRRALDAEDHADTPIMAYSAKFASAFYGPFREAAQSAPTTGDRSSYQHDPGNGRHALREMRADIAEGADILMVKPGLPYLDVLAAARAEFELPLASYWVSGEYAMVKAAAERGWIDERAVVLESLLALRRAGADLIVTYHALDASDWL